MKFHFIPVEIHEDYKAIVSRRVFTVTGQRPDDDEVERMIDTGESEGIFQQAILEQGKAQVYSLFVLYILIDNLIKFFYNKYQSSFSSFCIPSVMIVQVMDTIVEIEERHEAIKELEQGLTQLHQMFVDMATLVEQQGELILNIENSVTKASDYVAKGAIYRNEI